MTIQFCGKIQFCIMNAFVLRRFCVRVHSMCVFACRELQSLVSACVCVCVCVALCILFVRASRLWFVFTSVAKHTVLHMLASFHHTCVCVCVRREG